MTELYIIPVTKTNLDSIPEDVRVLAVHLGHLRNEIMGLQKLLWASQQYETTEEIRISMRAYQSLMMTRILAGKLMEGWDLLNKSYFGAKLSKTHETQLDASGQAAIAALKVYFGKNGLMHEVRNKFAFHYDPDKIRSTVADLKEPSDLKIYISEKGGNTFYQFSEAIVNIAMLDGIEKDNYEAALRKLMDQVLEIAQHFTLFCDSWLSLVTMQYFVKDPSLDKLEKVSLSDPPKLSDIGLDYFTE